MQASPPISIVGQLHGRYGISVAANAHVHLLRDLCAEVQPCHGPDAQHVIVYHHAEMPLVPPRWYARKKVIGYWVIESSLAAAKAKATADACTQIWTPSEASAQAIRALGSKTPVLVIPHPVAAPESVPDRSGRDTVTTLYAFAPGWERKNPEGTIKAWQDAFPKSSALGKEARLIIKSRLIGPAAKRLLEVIVGNDSRVELIFEDLNHEQMQALYARADIFLSLHFAGAFELHVAEAAAWGLPVVCTAVGGVVDYIPADGGCLIDGVKIAPRMEDPLNRAGEWTAPDHAAAVEALQSLARSLKRRMTMGTAARESVMKLLSPKRISLRMEQALEEVKGMKAPKLSRKQLDTMRGSGLPPVPVTPALRPVRAGLELMTANGKAPQPGTPCIISHRRSGTHLMAELLRQAWGRDEWLKTHDFPERRPAYPTLYVARNPVDALWSHWQWWQAGGGACNDIVASALKGMSFEAWLSGEAGRAIGFRSCFDGGHDSFEVTRGQFYDPLRYWIDHVSAAIDAGLTIVLYEDIVREPMKVAESVSAALKQQPVKPLRVVEKPVGLHPSPEPRIGGAWEQWPEAQLERLRSLLTPALLKALGQRSLEAWCGR